jgi:hypothetical protein
MDISDAESGPATYTDDTVGDEEGRRIAELGTRLADQLIQFHGCCSECHEQASQEHEDRYEHHYSLQEFLSETRDCCPDVLGSNKIASFEDDLRSSMTAAQKRWTFSGIHPRDPTEEPAHICLRKDQTPCQTGRIKFDVDSITGFCSSLGVAQGGIRWNWTQMPVSDLKSSLHLAKRRVQYSDSHGHLHSVLRPVHEIPHYTLGRLVGFEDVSLYLLFPRLYREEQQSSRLLDSDFQTWLDRVLLPALYQQHDGGDVQHYPASYNHAKYNSTARGVEGRSQKVDMMPRQQPIMNFVQPDELHAVWQRIQESIEQPGLQQFKGATILLHAKNLKTLIRDRTWTKMIDRLRRYWSTVVDESYMTSSFFFDVAKETSPFQAYVVTTDTTDLPQAETLFWKRCCLESFYSWLRAGDEAHAWQQNIYPTTLLADSVSMGFEPGPRSLLRAAGLLFGQAYNSIKEIFAAGDQYPFTNTAIETMALDPQLRKTWQHVGAGLSHNPVALFKAYLYAKNRCYHGIHDSSQKSFGVREEYRVSTALLSAITGRFEERGLHDQELAPPQSEQPYFTQPTASATSWFKWNINKFCTGFELVSSLSSQNWVTWEHTRIMLMFLRCLRFSYGGGRPQEAAGLWRDVRHAPSSTQPGGTRQMEGLGFEVTIPQHGYGWFLEKVDWETMTFKAPYSQYMTFNSVSMQRAYRARYSQIRDVQDDFIRVSKIHQLMQEFGEHPRCQGFLQDTLQQICLCAFRKDVFQHIKHLIRKDCLEGALAGKVPLCWPSVNRVFKPRSSPLLVSGGRLAVQSIEVLFTWLWEWKGDYFKRKHWDNKPYRLLYRRSFEIIELMQGTGRARQWKRELMYTFIKSHWLLPYPQGDRFMKSEGKSRVLWWSSYHPGIIAYYEGQERVRAIRNPLPAGHVGHYPTEGWGLSLKAGQYMPYEIEPPCELADLSESEVYERATELSSGDPLAPEPDRYFPEVYSIDTSDQGHVATFRPVRQAEIKLGRARERLRTLRYRPRAHSPQPEASSGDEEGLDGSGSDKDELDRVIQEQGKVVRRRASELDGLLADEARKARAKEERLREQRLAEIEFAKARREGELEDRIKRELIADEQLLSRLAKEKERRQEAIRQTHIQQHKALQARRAEHPGWLDYWGGYRVKKKVEAGSSNYFRKGRVVLGELGIVEEDTG